VPYQLNATIHSIFLSDFGDIELAGRNLNMVVTYVAMSASAMNITQFLRKYEGWWRVLRDAGFYVMDDGFTSKSVSAKMFACER